MPMDDYKITMQEDNDYKSESYLTDEYRIDLQEMLRRMMFVQVGNNQQLVEDLKKLNDDKKIQ